MKHKHIILVWLLADTILAIATFLYSFFSGLSSSNESFKTTFLFCGYGLIFSLPSLLLLLFANSFLIKQRLKNKDTYVFAILGVNFLYLITTTLLSGFHDAGIYFLFFAGTTIAGLLALYLVKRFILLKNQSI